MLLFYFNLNKIIMIIPEELLRCSTKELTEKLPKDKFKAKYFVDGENIYKLYNRFKNTVSYTKTNSKAVYTDSNYLDFLKNVRLLQVSDIKDSRKDNLIKQLEKKSIEYKTDYLRRVVSQFFIEDHYDIISNVYTIDIILYYPELTITNSIELSHKLKDIYILLKFNSSNLELKELSMTRTTYSSIEYNSGYMYSHVNIHKLQYWTSEFCWGTDTAIKKVQSKLRNGKILDFTQFLVLFKAYLEWESIEGKPYYYISSLIDSSKNYKKVYFSALEYKIEYFISCISANLKDLSYTYTIDELYYKIELLPESIDKIKELLTTHFPQHCFYLVNGSSCRFEISNTVPTINIQSQVVFKGEQKYLTIEKEEIQPNPSIPMVIHTDILEKVVEVINSLLTEYMLNKFEKTIQW
jgi:hypothetical protein